MFHFIWNSTFLCGYDGKMGVIEEEDTRPSFSKSDLVGLDPMIITPIDLESIALTTWPQHMFMPFYTKDILYKIYHNHKITFNILSILYLKNNLLVYPPFIAKEIIYILLLILSFFYSYDYNYNQNVFIKYFIPSLFVMIPYFHPNLHVLSVKALMTRA